METSLAARSNGELQKVLPQVVSQVSLARVVKEHATKLLTGAKNLAPARSAQPLICCGEVEQLERTVEREHEAIRSLLRMRTERSLDITSDVAELFG